MSAEELLTQGIVPLLGVYSVGMRPEVAREVARTQLDTLKTAGYAVVELPEVQPKSDLYDVHFNVEYSDEFMTGPRTPRVCIDTKSGEIYQVCTPTEHIKPVEARSLAAALLAAADAAEAEK